MYFISFVDMECEILIEFVNCSCNYKLLLDQQTLNSDFQDFRNPFVNNLHFQLNHQYFLVLPMQDGK